MPIDESELAARIDAWKAAKRALLASGRRDSVQAADGITSAALEREALAILARDGTGAGPETSASTSTPQPEAPSVIATTTSQASKLGTALAPKASAVARTCPRHGPHTSRTGCVKCKAETRARNKSDRAAVAAREPMSPALSPATPARTPQDARTAPDPPDPPTMPPDAATGVLGGSPGVDAGPALPVIAPPHPSPHPSLAGLRAELDAMGAILDALEGLDALARQRVGAWLCRAVAGVDGEGEG